MNPLWEIERAEFFSSHQFAGLRLTDVLVEFDGPQIGIWEDKSKAIQFFGVLADEDKHASRWILSLTDPVELDALYLGAVSVRDVLLKELVLVIDVADDLPRNVWRSTPASIDEAFLPARHALLPKLVREAKRPAVPDAGSSYSIRIGHYPAGRETKPEHMLEFGDLSKLLAVKQRLWTAAGQVVAGNKGRDDGTVPKAVARNTKLYASGARDGSFVVQVVPADAEMFAKAGEQISRVVFASDDPDRLPIVLSSLRRRMTSAYTAYLRILEKGKLSVLTRWSEGAFYVGAGAARRIRHAVSDAKFGEKDFEEISVRGHFLSYTMSKDNPDKRRFRFYDQDQETEYEGEVLPNTRLPDITVGTSANYKVTILTHVDVNGAETHLLEALSEATTTDLSLTPPPFGRS